MDVNWRPVPSPCLTLVRPFLNLSLHQQTIRCDMTLFPYCTDIILRILTRGYTFTPQKCITALCSSLVQVKLGVSMFMAKKLMTEMDYQGHTCTTMVGEQ